MKRAAFAFVILAGCAPTDAPLTDVTIPLRNPTAPIASQADVTLARLVGDWTVLAAEPAVANKSVVFSDTVVTLDGVAMPVTPQGEGRFSVGSAELWVLWADFDDRTVVLGDPDGRGLYVLDRTGNLGDRRAAVREILDWYGYDLTRVEGI